MKKYVYLFFLTAAFALISMSNRNGRASSSGLGSTGAPGDDNTVCQSCHNGPTDVAIQILLIDGGDTISKYEPNKTYQIHIRVNYVAGTKPKAHGFQMTLLNAAKNVKGPNLKTIVPLSSNVKLATALNGRLYAEQVDRSTTNLFETQWTAPVAGSGSVTIYAGGTGVNSNDSDTGDGGSKSSLQVDEKIPSAIKEASASSILFYPNPFAERFWIQGLTDDLRKIEIVDLFGKKISEIDLADTKRMVDLSNLNDGIFFAKLIDKQNNVIKTQKLMKRSQRP